MRASLATFGGPRDFNRPPFCQKFSFPFSFLRPDRIYARRYFVVFARNGAAWGVVIWKFLKRAKYRSLTKNVAKISSRSLEEFKHFIDFFSLSTSFSIYNFISLRLICYNIFFFFFIFLYITLYSCCLLHVCIVDFDFWCQPLSSVNCHLFFFHSVSSSLFQYHLVHYLPAL